MARFEDLPLDLLPQILVHLLIPDHIASLCLVNRTFYAFSVPNLYRRIAILPWHKSPKSRVCGLFSVETINSRQVIMQVVKLFSTLAVCPNLASLVHQLGSPLTHCKDLLPYMSIVRD
jgi:F-box associated protein